MKLLSYERMEFLSEYKHFLCSIFLRKHVYKGNLTPCFVMLEKTVRQISLKWKSEQLCC